MSFDWTVNVGHIFTLLGLVGVAFGVYFSVKGTITLIGHRLEILAGRMLSMEVEMRDMSKVLTSVAVQDQRMNNLDKQIAEQASIAEEHRKWTREQIAFLLQSRIKNAHSVE